jgi:hypothetical protein
MTGTSCLLSLTNLFWRNNLGMLLSRKRDGRGGLLRKKGSMPYLKSVEVESLPVDQGWPAAVPCLDG